MAAEIDHEADQHAETGDGKACVPAPDRGNAAAEDGRGGKCLKQILPREGTIWQSCMKPNTIFGDNTWESYELSADVRIIGGDVEIGGHHDDLDKMGYRFGVN